MNELRAFQETLKRVCFAEEADETDLAYLGGDRDRWLIYRGMVRVRLSRTLRGGVPRVAEALGDTFDTHVSAFFASDAITSRYFRHAVELFAAFLAPRVAADEHVATLLWYERALWEARDDVAEAPEASAFDFDAQVTFNPTLRARVSEFDATRQPAVRHDPARLLLVWRKGESRRLGHAVLPPYFATWIAKTQSGATPSEALRDMNAAGDITLDGAFLDGFTTSLGELIEGGAVLGSR